MIFITRPTTSLPSLCKRLLLLHLSRQRVAVLLSVSSFSASLRSTMKRSVQSESLLWHQSVRATWTLSTKMKRCETDQSQAATSVSSFSQPFLFSTCWKILIMSAIMTDSVSETLYPHVGGIDTFVLQLVFSIFLGFIGICRQWCLALAHAHRQCSGRLLSPQPVFQR